MAYTARSRDRFKRLVAFVTGAAALSAVAGTGAASAFAAHQTALQDQQRAREATGLASKRASARQVAHPARVRRKTARRKHQRHRTGVDAGAVQRASRRGVAAVGPGGSLRRSYPSPRSRPSDSSSATGASGSSRQAAAPAPSPAPTSGS